MFAFNALNLFQVTNNGSRETEIYQWNATGLNFIFFEAVPVGYAMDVAAYEIGGNTFLAVTSLNNLTRIFFWATDGFITYQV